MNLSNWWSRVVAKSYDKALSGMEEHFLGEQRRQLLSKAKGQVLEIGAGTGVNFPYYPEKCQVLAIEPSTPMREKALAKMDDKNIKAQINIQGLSVEELEGSGLIPLEGFDTIVATLVLCSLPKAEPIIEKFDHWLKLDGRVLVIEHIQSSHPLKATLFNWLTPLWRRLAEGCHLNRSTDRLLRKLPFKLVQENYFRKGIPFYVAEYLKTIDRSVYEENR